MALVVAVLALSACSSDDAEPAASEAKVVKRELRPGEVGFHGEFHNPRDQSVPRPAVVVFGGSEGGLSTAALAAALASEGVPALALAYFKEDGLPDELRSIPLEYFADGLRWLARQPGVDPARLVVWGSSRGSEAALLLGVHFPDLVHAAVVLNPSNLVLSAVPPHLSEPAWTLAGSAMPFTNRFGPDPGDVPESVIPAEGISGPMLLVCGGFDHVWKSCPMADAIIARRQGANPELRQVLLDYPDAGHGLSALPKGLQGDEPLFLQGLNEDANAAARADAWPKVLEFLRSL